MRLLARRGPFEHGPTRVATRRYFEKRAQAFDRLHTDPNLSKRLLRSGPARGRELAASVVARHPGASVLDVGCGPGRVAEAVIDAGAGSYVGIDFSPRMLTLARGRLGRFDAAELLEGDFLELDVQQTFDIVIALGLFDYLAEPEPAAAWLHARCSSTLVASFARWDWIKGPIRHFHYEVVHGCPIWDWTEVRAEALLAGAGFSNVEYLHRGRRGFFLSAGSAR